MSHLTKTRNGHTFRDIDAWEALKKRDLEYAINLLVSGEWTIDGVIKDGWGSLDARVGGERCHETALLALILRRLVIKYLRDSKLLEEFKALVIKYRANHAQDKPWTKVFKVQDVYVDNSNHYSQIMESIINTIGPDWTMFIGSARTLASFSVLSTMECGLTVYYRRLGDVLVATSKGQRAAGMGEYHDAEYPLRTSFTDASFELIDKLSAKTLPERDSEKPFGPEPLAYKTLPEQAREVFHFSKANKIIPGHNDCPIIVGSFSASMQILIRLCWLYKIPITLCMPRLRYEKTVGDLESLATYKLTSAPVRTYVAVQKAGGSFKMVDSIKEGIEDEPCWKLGGYSMYHESQLGSLLSSGNDDEYNKALDQAEVGHLMSLFGFVHPEYPLQTENGGADLVALRSSICGEVSQSTELTFEGINSGWGLEDDGGVNNVSLRSLASACNKVTSQYNLHDTVLATQRHIDKKKASYRMQCKPIPFTFDHIDISTPRHEKAKWTGILKRHLYTTEPMYANLFVVGRTVYSMRDQTEADRLMILVNNDNQKLNTLLERHPEHSVFLTQNHQKKVDEFRKRNKREIGKKKARSKVTGKRRF
ncbi:hypothetical protein FPOA_06656 [Fusarium poae]|uniref:Uncharacterized protein n=1 Tax=Fusarium poae TaxID=36050 RepID=A0A1B8A3W9_FUSPO|nr:hypothetical protein FPOA_13919 [Fusarium poae]OBS20274.1 hypothetical protein FPOA_06656 [Fusarium poae]